MKKDVIELFEANGITYELREGVNVCGVLFTVFNWFSIGQDGREYPREFKFTGRDDSLEHELGGFNQLKILVAESK